MTPQKEIVQLTAELVAFRTTADRPDQIRACLEYIKAYLADTPLIVQEFKLLGKPGLVISFSRGKQQELLLNGHIDVVDGFDTQFTVTKKGNQLYGRGTNDMKASVATMLVLLRRIALRGRKPRVALLLVSDEETGGTGTCELARRGYLGDFVIVGEQTKLRIETKHKGHLAVRVTAYGASSHASRPWLGSNAIEKLIKQLARIHAEIPQATRSNKWLPTVNVTSFVSLSPSNVTPSKAEMVLDIRTTEEWSNRRILNVLKRLKFKVTKLHDGAMLKNKRKDSHIRALRRIADRVVGKKRKYVKSCGSTDARFFSARGIPVVSFGPTGGKHHTGSEYVEIDALGKFYRILESYIRQHVQSYAT